MESAERGQLEELLSAYLDGELDAEGAALVEGLLGKEDSARQLLEELRQTAHVVSTLPRHAAPPGILEDVRSHIERGELLGDFEDARAGSHGWRTPIVAMLSMAAMLALVSVSVWYYRDGPGVDSGPGDDMVTMAAGDRDESEVRERLAEKETVGKRSRVATRHSGEGDVVRKTRRDKKGGAGGKGPRGPIEEETVAQTAAPRDSYLGRPAIALSQRSEVNLLATATVDQKLATSLHVTELRQHPFGNEAVRLQLATDDRGQRDAIAARLVSRLAGRQILDLADQDGSLPARAVASGGFYLRGRPGVNFEPVEEKQILIRVAAHDFNALLDEVDELPIASDQVTLFSGPFGVRGLAYARRLLGEMAPGWRDREPGERGGRLFSDEEGETEGASDTAQGRERERVAQGTGTLSDLIDSLSPGLGETFAARPDGASAPGRTKEETSAETAAPSRPGQPPLPTVAAGEERPEGLGDHEDLAKAVATTTPKPTNVKADDSEVSRRLGGKRGPAVVAEPSSLVDRRLKELDEPRQIADAGMVPDTESQEKLWSYDTRESTEQDRLESAVDVPPTTEYLTVVIRLVIEKPELEKPPAKDPGAEAPVWTKRQPPPQSPPPSLPQQ